MKGSEKNEKKRGGSSHLTRAQARQGMEGRASCFRQSFSTEKGRFPAIWNEISTKTKGGQLRQRCLPTVWEKRRSEEGGRKMGGGGGKKVSRAGMERGRVCRKTPSNEK